MSPVQVLTDAVPHVDASTVARFAKLPVAAVSDALQRDPGAGGLVRVGGWADGHDVSMAGPGLTVRTRPGDNLALHVALDMVRPGEVIVVDGGADVRNALLGELIAMYAMKKGAGGIVVDGAVRDSEELRDLPLPVYARAVTHRGPYKTGPGFINGPVSIGGTVVNPGDLLVGDLDGVVVVPSARAADVASSAEAVVEQEVQQRADISEGRWDRSWLVTAADIIGPDGQSMTTVQKIGADRA